LSRNSFISKGLSPFPVGLWDSHPSKTHDFGHPRQIRRQTHFQDRP
jgi:hypothetical protein